MMRAIKVICCLLVSLAVIVSFSSCNFKKVQERVSISLTCDSIDSSFSFLLNLKNKFPNIDFKFTKLTLHPDSYGLSNVSDSQIYWEQATSNCDVPDIAISSSFSKDLPGLKSAFADISGESFTANYQYSYLNASSIDGKAYYLPYSVTLGGIVYNENLFNENGWSIPQSNAEFVQLLETISASTDITPLLLLPTSDFAADLFSMSYLLNDGASLEGFRFYEEMMQGKVQATAKNFEHTFEYLRFLSRNGLTNVDSSELVELVKTNKVAMCISPSTFLTFLNESDSSSSFKMMPLFTPLFPNGVLFEQNISSIAISAASMADEQKAEAIRDIMTYISSKEGQLDQISDSRIIISPCYGVMSKAEYSQDFSDILKVIESGAVINNKKMIPLDESFSPAFSAFLTNSSNANDGKELISAFNSSHAAALDAVESESVIIASATSDFSRQEVENLLLQAMQSVSGCDASILPAVSEPNEFGEYSANEMILSKVYKGDLTEDSMRIAIKHGVGAAVFTMTGEQLLLLLDSNSSFKSCYGMKIDYIYEKKNDSYSISSAYFSNGEEVEQQKTYTVCLRDNVNIPEGNYISKEPLNNELVDILISYCLKEKIISPISLNNSNYIK